MIPDKLGWGRETKEGGQTGCSGLQQITKVRKGHQSEGLGSRPAIRVSRKRSRPPGLEGHSQGFAIVVSAEQPRPERGGEVLVTEKTKDHFIPRVFLWGVSGYHMLFWRCRESWARGRGREWKKGRFWLPFFHPSFGNEFLVLEKHNLGISDSVMSNYLQPHGL